MGVPKFFRYISERYPCLSEFVKEYQIPVFDNLYLDMNGIIHMCSHPDDNNPHFRITEEKIFADIFHYIEVLFRMIKPQKVFFMAVDGVAPRAKMNQQRGRRFRSAKDAEKLETEALRKGEKLPEVERFDSNCITPGTEFMARLHEQLKYFVVHKVSTDKLWKKCKIILSGHETPGEGEHKIMDYIRYIRSQDGYDPNTRHCLYGLDADLIMLGLCTHDPHFCLLREEVKFGKKTKRTNVPEEIRFYLLHLSLMREYLELEFAPLKDSLQKSDKVKFDIEKIIDDWILMGFLVGNDFIPNLPNLHIANGALPVLYQAYMEVLPTLDGYINEEGTLNLERFEKFMTQLSDIDFKNFEETQADMLYFEKKTGRKPNFHSAVQSKLKNDEETIEGSNASTRSELEALIARTEELDVSSEDESEKSSSNEDEQFKIFKDEYYRNKLEYQKVTPEVMREQAEGYVRAIQWNLNYYYNGVCSWSWFYPHHYSPYISDIKGFSNLKIDFELGKPFKPYEQLLAVLPTASKNLLPKCYHHLMTDENSMIKSYYPEEFQTDLNGKRQEWEAVVLVPFIDEKILLDAMQPCNELLTIDEKERNSHGPMLIYEYTEDDLGVYRAPDYFPNISRNQALCTPVYMEDIRIPKEKLIKGAYPGACFDVFYPGFPTMKHLKYEGEFMRAKVKVFEMPSRNENLMLKLLPSELYFEDSVPTELLGKTVWVGWPHLVEAKVVAMSNRKQKYVLCENDSKNYKVEETKLFESQLDGITQHHRDRLGILFGKTNVLVHVKIMIGRKYIFTSHRRVTLEKQFSEVVSSYPLQSIVCDVNAFDEFHSAYADISEVFPTDSVCFSLTQPYYGSQGTVMDSKDSLKNNQLKVSLLVVEEPDLAPAQKIAEKLKNSYQNLTNSASQIAVSNYVFSRITGSLYVSTKNFNSKSINIGLDLKFNKKNEETPGYTRKIDNVWYYTRNAVDLVAEYVDKFPELFDHLAKSDDHDIIAETVFKTDSDEKVKEIQSWLKTLPIHNIERRACDSCVLEQEVVAEIEKIIDQMNETPKTIVMQIKPHLLHKPEIQSGNIPPDPLTTTKVFDRIVNVREGFTVPLGLKGTVIGIYKSSDVLKNEDEMYDIVFDKPFPGGMALNCSDNRGYRLPRTSFINLSHGKRQMEQKTGIPGALRALAKERRTGNNHNTNYANATINPRQQNSAFATFNRQPNLIPTTILTKNFQQNTVQYHSAKPQQQMNKSQDQHKVKNSFYYMADYSQTPHSNLNKENKKKSEVVGQNKQTTKEPSTVSEKPFSSKVNTHPRTEVDTDFLKRILNIDNNANGNNRSKSVPQPNEAVRSWTKPNASQHDDKYRSRPDSSGRRDQNFASASARLLSYYQSNSLGCPRYTYFEEENGFSAQVVLPNSKAIYGKPARSREEASENVALDALNLLQNENSQPSKETLPSKFPVPPTNWVEHQQKPFVNKSYQTKHQKATGNSVDYKKSQGPSFSRNYTTVQHNSTHRGAHNFVPLQALKKRHPHNSRNVGNVNRTFNENPQSTRQEQQRDTQKISQNDPSSKVQGTDSRDRLIKSNRPRKTRIAANFNK